MPERVEVVRAIAKITDQAAVNVLTDYHRCDAEKSATRLARRGREDRRSALGRRQVKRLLVLATLAACGGHAVFPSDLER